MIVRIFATVICNSYTMCIYRFPVCTGASDAKCVRDSGMSLAVYNTVINVLQIRFRSMVIVYVSILFLSFQHQYHHQNP